MRVHVIVALVLVSTVAAGSLAAPAAGQAGVSLSIDDVAVTPSPPPVDEEFTVGLSVRNRHSGSTTYRIESATLLVQEDGDLERLDEVKSGRRLTPGAAESVELGASFDTAGARQLRLRVLAETDSGERVILERQFDVDVGGEQPQIDVDVDRAYANTETPVTVTVANGLSVDARNVDVRLRSEDLDVLSTRTVHSRLPSGESQTFEFPVVANASGPKEATVTVAYTDEEGDRNRLRERATLVFEPISAMATPRVTVDAADAVAGVPSPVNVTVANGLDRDVRDLELRLRGDVDVRDDRRLVARLPAGETAAVSFPVVAQSTEPNVTVSLDYEVDGRNRTVEESQSIAVDPLEDDVDLEARSTDDGSVVAVEVFNLGNVAIENVILRGDDPDVSVSRALVDRLPPGSSRDARLNVSGVASTDGVDLDVAAVYDVGDRRGTANTSVRVASNPGTIRLTGVQVDDEGDRLHITGSASNAGLTEVNSVLVSVVDGEHVDPEPPNREYFVGTVPESDFVSFDLFASVEGNVSEVPVRIEYIVDGERREHVVGVPYDSEPRTTPVQNESSGVGLVPAAVGGVVLLGIIAIIYVGWRNRDGGA